MWLSYILFLYTSSSRSVKIIWFHWLSVTFPFPASFNRHPFIREGPFFVNKFIWINNYISGSGHYKQRPDFKSIPRQIHLSIHYALTMVQWLGSPLWTPRACQTEWTPHWVEFDGEGNEATMVDWYNNRLKNMNNKLHLFCPYRKWETGKKRVVFVCSN